VQVGRHYAHAPITEAVIELACTPAPGVTLDDLTRVADHEVFTTSGPAIVFSGRIDVSPGGIVGDTSGEQIGHAFRRSDGLRVLQSRLNGFAYSIFAPYDTWETFSAEAWRYWQAYRSVARPTVASRLGVRYINKIDIPQVSIEIKDYLRTAVDVSPYLPQLTARYFLQVVVPILSFDASATITSTIVAPPNEESTSLILDIDTWREFDISLEGDAGDDRIREALADLRKAKNYVFEACITDATRGLIS
jgi:uncharacterized protein (TIGR04255 family)